MIPLWMYLVVGAALFSIGVYGALARRNAIAVLMSIELMLNAVNINLVGFWRYLSPSPPVSGFGSAVSSAPLMAGQAFAAFVFVIAAAEVAAGLAIIIAVYRNRRSVVVEEADLLRG